MILTLWIIAWICSGIVQSADNLLAFLGTIEDRVTLQIART